MSEIFVVRLGNTEWLGGLYKPVDGAHDIGKIRRYVTLNGAYRAMRTAKNKGMIQDERLAGVYRVDTSKPYFYTEKITNSIGTSVKSI